MAEPVRVQQSRKRGWRKPENTVVVSRPSKWGNRFRVQRIGSACGTSSIWNVVGGGFSDLGYYRTEVGAKAVAVGLFREHLRGSTKPEWRWMREHLADLRGKNLACWCPLPEPGEPDMCHAAVLLEVANA